jgi:twinkle protein
VEVRQYLREKGFNWSEIRRNKGLQAVMPCPKCGDTKKFAISLEDGAYRCLRANNCGIKGSFTDFQRMFGDKPKFINSDRYVKYSAPKTYAKPKVDGWDKLDADAIEFLKARSFKGEIIAKFKLRSKQGAIVYPYFMNGEHVFTKFRAVKEKKFWRDAGTMPVLYNMDACTGEELYIVEGENDSIAAAHYNINAVSIPSGVEDLDWIELCWDFLQQFKKIYLVMDSDKAGMDATEVIANRLGKWRCYNITLPLKDMNECLINDIPEDDILRAIVNAQDYSLPSLKSAGEFIQDVIDLRKNKHKLYGVPTGFTELDALMKGWREAEVTIWTGNSGSGKTNFLNQVLINLAEQGEKCGILSLEMPPKKLLNWMVMMYREEADPDDETVRYVLNKLDSNLFVVDMFGEKSKDVILDTFEFGARKYGIKHFVIDSMMKVAMYGNNELQMQKDFVSSLVDFSRQFDAHVHLVAHPRKGQDDNDKPGKVDVSGTGHITNLAHNVLVMWKPGEKARAKAMKEDKPIGDNVLHVKKNREWGIEGEADYSFFPEYKKFKEW